MNHLLKYYTLSFLMLGACQPGSDETLATESQNTSVQSVQTANYPVYFNDVLGAHGELEQWNKFRTMQFQLENNGASETHLIDLKTRKDLVKAQDYTIGYDGQQVWVSPTKASYPGKSARFYHNLFFYFYAIPYVLADPGVNFEKLQDKQLNGKTYQVIEVSFNENIGDTPEDKYQLLINPSTNRLEWLLYTVTFFDSQSNNKFNALKYEDYQEYKGLLFPQTLTGYFYEDGKTGDVRYSVKFNNLQLKTAEPNQQQFQKPQNAEVDSLLN